MTINPPALPVRNEKVIPSFILKMKERIRQDLQDRQNIFCLSGRKAKSIIDLETRFKISAKAGLPFTLSSGKSKNN
jgi:hypothetical protein